MTYVGIIGGGNISVTHARAALEIPGVELAAWYGHNQDRTRRLSELYGGTLHETFQSFLAHRPMDLVLIGSPSGMHAEQGVLAARQGLHLLVEKPLDITTERIDLLINECHQAGVKLGVFFQDRVAPDIRKLKEILDAGQAGKPILVSGSVKWYRPPEYYGDSRWRGTWALDGGGALMNQGVHTVDLLLWLMGDVTRVSAKATTAFHDIEVEDTVVATLEFASGAVGVLQVATSVYPGYQRRVEVTGSEGTIILEHDRIVATDLRDGLGGPTNPSESNQNPSATSAQVSDVSGHRRILEDFLRAIETNGTPVCDGREGRRSVELVQAIYESSSTGQSVKLHPPNI
ncbi:MAG: Gfo/Idh/MocA family oxidoreductase [Pyrinomonadaceae bacterium]|nr:Gfo/Idh/MocA family oxidoreductase [Pyrinomonadaceae bacterium]